MFITRTKLHLQTNRKNTGIFIFRDLQNGVDYIEIWEFSRRSRSWSWNTCNGIVNCDVPAARPVLCQPPPSVADWQSPARRPSAIRQNGIPGQGVLVLRQCAHSANICNRLCFFLFFFSSYSWRNAMPWNSQAQYSSLRQPSWRHHVDKNMESLYDSARKRTKLK